MKENEFMDNIRDVARRKFLPRQYQKKETLLSFLCIAFLQKKSNAYNSIQNTIFTEAPALVCVMLATAL